MKKILSLVLALSMVLGMFSFSFAGFADVEGTKYAGAVEALVGIGVVNGYTDGTFQPEKVVTRAEMAKMLVIALGQEDAADLAKGATKFNDVAADHWAAGFINVASQNNIVSGYPDGNFDPEATVTYSETITMAVRALGYKNVVETSGTWPTNYMTKGVELGFLDDVVGSISGSAGATRGNSIMILWNMLRCQMWVVQSENATTGVTYGKSTKNVDGKEVPQSMLNIKFPNYDFETYYFAGFSIKDNETVEVAFVENEDDLENESAVPIEYDYERNDFYTFIPGTEVEVLVNTEEDLCLTIAPTEDMVIVEGRIDELEDEYSKYERNNDNATYAYLLLNADKSTATVKGRIELLMYSDYLNEVEVEETYVRIYYMEQGDPSVKKEKLTEEIMDKILVLVDGERAKLEDLEAGMVITQVYGMQDILFASTDTAEGTVNKLVGNIITVDDEEYVLAAGNSAWTDLEEEYDSQESVTLNSSVKDQDATLYLNFVGEAVRLEFEETDDEEETDTKYFVTENYIDYDRTKDCYDVNLVNEDGSDTYDFADDDYAADFARSETGEIAKYSFVKVELNDDNEITKITSLVRSNSEEGITLTLDGSYLYNGATEVTKVVSGTVIVKIVTDEDGNVTVDFEEGKEALSKTNHGVVLDGIVANEDDTNEADYIVMLDDTNESDLVYGLVTDRDQDALTSYYYVTVEDEEGTEETYVSKSATGVDEGRLIAFVLEEDSEGDTYLKVKESARPEDFLGEGIISVGAINSDGRVAYEDADKENKIVDLDEADKAYDPLEEDLEEYTFVLADVDFDDEYFFDGFEIIDLEDLKLKVEDRIGAGKNENLVIIYRLSENALEEESVT